MEPRIVSITVMKETAHHLVKIQWWLKTEHNPNVINTLVIEDVNIQIYHFLQQTSNHAAIVFVIVGMFVVIL